MKRQHHRKASASKWASFAAAARQLTASGRSFHSLAERREFDAQVEALSIRARLSLLS